jgi:hypothetical protein
MLGVHKFFAIPGLAANPVDQETVCITSVLCNRKDTGPGRNFNALASFRIVSSG